MKMISNKVTMAIATALHSFDLLPTGTFDEMQEKLSDDAVIKRCRNDHVFRAKVCSLTASVLRSVGDDLAELTRQRDLAVEALAKISRYADSRPALIGVIADEYLEVIKENK